MFSRRSLVGLAATGFVLAATGVASAQDWKSKYPELIFSVVPAENAKSLQDDWTPFMEYLSKELGVKVTLRIANDYAAVIEGQRSGNIHIANYGAASYSRAKITGVETEAFLTDLNKDGTKGYYSVFFVRANSPFMKVMDLKGKNLGLVDPNSTSGNNVARFELDKMGINPEEFFSKVIYAGSHDNAILALAQGTVDIAANEWTTAEDNNVVLLSRKGLLKDASGKPLTYADFRVINKSSEILNGPYAVLSVLPADLKAAIKKAFLDAPTKAPAAFAKMYNGQKKGYVEVVNEDYKPFMDLIKFIDSLKKKKS